MAINISDLEFISNFTNQMKGKKSWGTSLGIGSFITINFGAALPAEGKNKSPRGEWYLWIYHCAWRIRANDQIVVGSEDPREILVREIGRLEGLRLLSITINPISFDTDFVFEDGITLQTIPISYTEDYEHWMLYTPNHKVLTAGPGISWSLENEFSSEL